jgi:hypothetical protein
MIWTFPVPAERTGPPALEVIGFGASFCSFLPPFVVVDDPDV